MPFSSLNLLFKQRLHAAEETLVSGEFESGFFGGPTLKYSQVG
jgi:hypothetical protein